ncbi:MAG: hypothetical protein ABIJ61_12250, partial [bacterium]
MLTHKYPLALLLVLLLVAAATAQPPVQLTAYDIDFQLDVPNGRILVDAIVHAEKQEGVEQFILLLTERAVFDTIAAEAGGKSYLISSGYVGKDSLQLSLPPELKAARQLALRFKYHIEIPDWGGSMMMLGRGHRWYPMIIDQIATVHLKTTAYTTFEIYSAGDLLNLKVEGDWEYREYQTNIPVFKIPLVISRAGFLTEQTATAAGIELHLLTSQPDSVPTTSVLDQAGKLLDYYQKALGPYPHRSLTMIEVGGFPGIEIGSGLLSIGRAAFGPYAQGEFSSLSLAIANQWLGAG